MERALFRSHISRTPPELAPRRPEPDIQRTIHAKFHYIAVDKYTGIAKSFPSHRIPEYDPDTQKVIFLEVGDRYSYGTTWHGRDVFRTHGSSRLYENGDGCHDDQGNPK